MESIQVEHSGALGREHIERERYVADWGERERMEVLIERTVWVFKLRSALVDFN